MDYVELRWLCRLALEKDQRILLTVARPWGFADTPPRPGATQATGRPKGFPRGLFCTHAETKYSLVFSPSDLLDFLGDAVENDGTGHCVAFRIATEAEEYASDSLSIERYTAKQKAGIPTHTCVKQVEKPPVVKIMLRELERLCVNGPAPLNDIIEAVAEALPLDGGRRTDPRRGKAVKALEVAEANGWINIFGCEVSLPL